MIQRLVSSLVPGPSGIRSVLWPDLDSSTKLSLPFPAFPAVTVSTPSPAREQKCLNIEHTAHIYRNREEIIPPQS